MLAIAGGKGGCGKTTTACGVAAALGRRGAAPIVVDADVAMPDLPRVVRAAPEPGLDALAAGRPVEAVVQSDHDLPGVGVVASGAPASLRPALAGLRATPEPVLVDCPAGAGPDVAAALSACNRALVVSTTTRASLEAATKTVAMATELEATVAGLVLRPAHHGQARPSQLPTRVRERLGVPWLVTVARIPDPGPPWGDRPSHAALARRLFAPP